MFSSLVLQYWDCEIPGNKKPAGFKGEGSLQQAGSMFTFAREISRCRISLTFYWPGFLKLTNIPRFDLLALWNASVIWQVQERGGEIAVQVSCKPFWQTEQRRTTGLHSPFLQRWTGTPFRVYCKISFEEASLKLQVLFWVRTQVAFSSKILLFPTFLGGHFFKALIVVSSRKEAEGNHLHLKGSSAWSSPLCTFSSSLSPIALGLKDPLSNHLNSDSWALRTTRNIPLVIQVGV